MLSDREIREIEEGRRRGLSGPILQTWLGKLLTDRRDRLQQLAHVRQRLEQAYAYLDRLLRGLETAPEPDQPKREDRRGFSGKGTSSGPSREE
jgi:type II secretory pathway component PulJ